MVLNLPGAGLRGLRVLLHQEPRAPKEREQARSRGLARIQLLVQQSAATRCMLHDPVGNAVPPDLRMGPGNEGHRGATVLQSCDDPDLPCFAPAHGTGPAAFLAKEFAR